MSSDPAPSTPPTSPAPDVPPNTTSQTSVQPPPGQAQDSGAIYPPLYPPYAPYPDAGYPGYAPYPYPASYPAPYAAPGYPAYFPWIYAPPSPRLGTWALVSMICGAVSIASFQSILAILAVVFGFIGLNEIKKSAGQVEGRGLAIAGVVMGFVSLGIGLVIVLLYVLYFVVIFATLSTFPG